MATRVLPDGEVRIDEAMIRAVATIAAEAAARVVSPRSVVGQDAHPDAGIGADIIEVAASAGNTLDLAGPGASLAVITGSGMSTLRVLGWDNKRRDVPAMSGMVLRVPFKRVQIIWASDATEVVRVIVSPRPDAVPSPPGCRCWEPFRVEETLDGNAETAVSLESGFDYDLDLMTIDLANSGTVGTRVPFAWIMDPAGGEVMHACQAGNSTAANQRQVMQILFGPGGGEERLDSGVNSFATIKVEAVINSQNSFAVGNYWARVQTANAAQFLFGVSGSQVADSLRVTIMGRRRMI